MADPEVSTESPLDLFPEILPKRIVVGGRKAIEMDVAALAGLADQQPGEPSPQMVRSIEKLGVLAPITVEQLGTTAEGEPIVRLIDGIRRIKAAVKAGHSKIPVALYEGGSFATTTSVEGTSAGAIAAALVSNYHRANNPALELALFERLLAVPGATDKQIATDLGIPLQMVQRRLRLRNLLPGLRHALDNDKLNVSVAEAVAALPKAQQERLVQKYEESGKVTAADVREMRQVVTKGAIQSLPESIFGGPTAAEAEHEPLESRIARVLKEVERLKEEAAGELTVLGYLDTAAIALRRAFREEGAAA